MRTRLNDPLTDKQYQVERSNWTWNDHILRTYATAAAVSWTLPDVINDPACGDGSVAIYADMLRPIKTMFLSDISEPSMLGLSEQHKADTSKVIRVGSVRENLHQVDTLILTEILEHLENPDALLRQAHPTAKFLVASSPLGETRKDNKEHVWGWDREGYEQMLRSTGWNPIAYQEIDFYPRQYMFQVWICRSS